MKFYSLIVAAFFIFFILPLASKASEDMVFIKGGCFEMGDTFGDGSPDEKPVHEVCLDDFYIGEHEVTQGEWREIMGSNPSFFKNCGNDCPVENVSWNDVQEFIRKLNEKTGTNYRLPTEAEWEYAAKERGKNVKFGTGKDTIGPDESNFNAKLEHKEPYSRSGIYREETLTVKSFSANLLGLYDMSGNVWEWVSDWYDRGYYKNSPHSNPMGPSKGSHRVVRGGSWNQRASTARTTYRIFIRPKNKDFIFGFRLASTPFDKKL